MHSPFFLSLWFQLNCISYNTIKSYVTSYAFFKLLFLPQRNTSNNCDFAHSIQPKYNAQKKYYLPSSSITSFCWLLVYFKLKLRFWNVQKALLLSLLHDGNDKLRKCETITNNILEIKFIFDFGCVFKKKQSKKIKKKK